MTQPSRTWMVAPRAAAMATIAALLCCVGCASEPKLGPFTSDGCSRFPDGTLGEREKWKECCYQHDKTYWRGGTWSERREADRTLGVCIDEVSNPALALSMYEGVRAGGSPLWPTRYRWGYGWPYGRGYRELSDEEQRSADEILATSEADDPPAEAERD